MQKNTCIVFIHSINEFHLSKNYATQTLCSRSIIQIFNRISLLNYIQINIISLGNLARFYLVIWHTETVILTYIVHPVANSRHPFTAPITSEIIFSAVLRFSM